MSPIHLFIFILSVYSAGARLIRPCRLGDNACVLASTRVAYPRILAGIPELNISSSDPLFHKKLEGDLKILKFTFTNATVTGFKDCIIDNVKFNLYDLKLKVNMTCLNLVLYGDYEINGLLIIMPVEGTGKFKIVSNKYLLGVDSDLKKYEGQDGKSYMKLKNFKLRMEAQDGVKFDFENLFNGQQKLGDSVIKYANQNWKAVADFVQEPIFIEDFKKISRNVNKYLKHIPFEDMFILK